MIKSLITIESWLFLFTIVFFIVSLKWGIRHRYYGFGVLLLLWLVCLTGFLPQYLSQLLEKKYPPVTAAQLHALPKEAYILVLGAGYTFDTSISPVEQLSGTVLSRLVEGLRIYKHLPGSKLIGSGSSSDPESPPQAIALKNAGVLLGVPDSDFLVQTTPANTREEAISYRRLFGDRHPLILVTSAVHMPRAVLYFRSQGLNPIPAPANFLIKPHPLKGVSKWIPSINNLGIMNIALREWAGILEYNMKYDKNLPR